MQWKECDLFTKTFSKDGLKEQIFNVGGWIFFVSNDNLYSLERDGFFRKFPNIEIPETSEQSLNNLPKEWLWLFNLTTEGINSIVKIFLYNQCFWILDSNGHVFIKDISSFSKKSERLKTTENLLVKDVVVLADDFIYLLTKENQIYLCNREENRTGDICFNLEYSMDERTRYEYLVPIAVEYNRRRCAILAVPEQGFYYLDDPNRVDLFMNIAIGCSGEVSYAIQFQLPTGMETKDVYIESMYFSRDDHILCLTNRGDLFYFSLLQWGEDLYSNKKAPLELRTLQANLHLVNFGNMLRISEMITVRSFDDYAMLLADDGFFYALNIEANYNQLDVFKLFYHCASVSVINRFVESLSYKLNSHTAFVCDVGSCNLIPSTKESEMFIVSEEMLTRYGDEPICDLKFKHQFSIDMRTNELVNRCIVHPFRQLNPYKNIETLDNVATKVSFSFDGISRTKKALCSITNVGKRENPIYSPPFEKRFKY